MLIECKLRRPGGTEIDLDGQIYTFAPKLEDGPHVCNVSDKTHAERLLSIPEGFGLAGNGKAKRKVKEPEPDASMEATTPILSGEIDAELT